MMVTRLTIDRDDSIGRVTAAELITSNTLVSAGVRVLHRPDV